jgi:hypothetical protein
MSLKEYNNIQVILFKKYNLTESDRFIQACQIISKYRSLNNTFTFLYNAMHELKKEHII